MMPAIVFIGGFLGAGKTTLILNAAQLLQDRGQRVALIMNDQDSELVDTKHALARQFTATEVSGGCFCCCFSDLLDQARAFLAYRPHVIFAEPVGSCIDLSATILQPFRAFHSDQFQTAPLTVLIDPERASEVLNGNAAPDMEYLFHQQIREADILCTTKADRNPAAPPLPFPIDFHLSAKTGINVYEWLTEVLSGNRLAGTRLLDVDYQQYADAEASFGWLNMQVSVRTGQPISPAALIGPLMEKLDAKLTAQNVTIAHLKLFDQTSSTYLAATICKNGQEPNPQGDLIGDAASHHELAINLRALGNARSLQSVVENTLSELDGSVDIKHCRAFQPSPPKPEHRFTKVINS